MCCSARNTPYCALASIHCLIAPFVLLVALSITAAAGAMGSVSATDYPSLQAAIDDNPGGVIHVPPGEYTIDAPLMIQHDRTVLEGFGRIIQTNSDAAIVRIDHADHVVLRDLTLMRPADAPDTEHQGVYAEHSDSLRLEGLRVVDNHTRSSAIRLQSSSNGSITNCEIVNYKRVAIDDRTRSPLLGYAFQCIDGTGIGVVDCVGTSILNNRVLENRMLPTREAAEKHQLGKLVEGQMETKFGELGLWVERAGRAQHWHQGSAILVSGPDSTAFTRISGNYIENAAQGIDIHSDNFICTENTVNHAMMGMKAMHGSRNGIVARNLFSYVDNWGIMVGPGTASRPAQAAEGEQPARESNPDGAIVISGNVISNFGRGHEFWNWGGDGPDAAVGAVIRIERGQLASNPPLSDILVEGNIITNFGKEGVLENGEVTHPKPRYRYTVLIDSPAADSKETHYPVNVRIVDNLFDPGTDGICNVPLPELN